jgi:hypothetical protein
MNSEVARENDLPPSSSRNGPDNCRLDFRRCSGNLLPACLETVLAKKNALIFLKPCRETLFWTLRVDGTLSRVGGRAGNCLSDGNSIKAACTHGADGGDALAEPVYRIGFRVRRLMNGAKSNKPAQATLPTPATNRLFLAGGCSLVVAGRRTVQSGRLTHQVHAGQTVAC